MKEIIVVKFGGSVITHKNDEPPRVNSEVLSRVVGEITDHYQGLVLILGGGAHGHQAAHSFGYGDASASKETLLAGVSTIRRNMTTLSTVVNQEFESNGIPAVVISPFMFATMADGKISNFPTYMYTNVLDAGISVITHGDVCFDSICGASILSGDTIVMHLVRELRAKRVLIGTDVDGVYDSDPRVNPEAQVIPVIDSANREDILTVAGPSGSTDVTGGMRKKISELLSIADYDREVIVFNLLVPGRLKSLLDGNSELCTRIKL